MYTKYCDFLNFIFIIIIIYLFLLFFLGGGGGLMRHMCVSRCHLVLFLIQKLG